MSNTSKTWSTKKKKPSKNDGPRKLDQRNKLLDWFGLNSKYITECGVIDIRKYIDEIVNYSHMIAVNKWITLRFNPLVKDYKLCKEEFTDEQWNNLFVLNKNDENIKERIRLRHLVKKEWYLRPRFDVLRRTNRKDSKVP